MNFVVLVGYCGSMHSSQHNITQHDMLPQYPTSTTKFIYDWFLMWLLM